MERMPAEAITEEVETVEPTVTATEHVESNTSPTIEDPVIQGAVVILPESVTGAIITGDYSNSAIDSAASESVS